MNANGTGEPLLSMRGITKRFAGTVALRDVSFELRSGEIHALVGENGAGKSTLMRILSGAYPASSYAGEIQMRGRPCRFHTPRDSERAGIEMIYQEISMHLDLSVGENLFLGRLPRGRYGLVDWPRVFQEAAPLLAQVRLDVSPGESVRNLSVGKQQLVAIARALSRRPSILVLDEPTSALTETEADNLLALLLQWRARGLSCVYISHRLPEVHRVADRITVLRDGATISTRESAGLDRGRLIEDMIGRKMEQMFPKAEAPIGAEVFRAEHFTVPHPYTSHTNIVDDVSLELRRGEVLGLAGLVGAGRSEFVNALFGAGEHDGRGRVSVEGRPVAIRGPRDAVRAGIGLVTEDRRRNGYVGLLDIGANITLAALDKVSARGLLDRDGEARRARGSIEALDIRAAGPDAELFSLSGGNQQKVVLAKWLMTDLKVLILDEPTRGIDIGAKVKIYETMGRLAREGVAMIMISSDLEELLAMCDRFIVLAAGRVTDRFPRSEASAHRIMRAAVGGI